MEIAVLIWIVCGIASAVIMDKKGKSGCLGFFLGVLLGPIGVLIALATTGRVCPYCRKSIPEKASICPYCQKEQPVDEKLSKVQENVQKAWGSVSKPMSDEEAVNKILGKDK